MDVFAEHGIAGVVGLLFNALFATPSIIGLDGVNTGVMTGGWLIHNYRQLYIQIAYILACGAYAFLMSAILAYTINVLPGCKLRADEAAELLGMDDDQLGEFAYDYVEVRRDYLAWTPAKEGMSQVEEHVEPGERHGIREHGEMASLSGASGMGMDGSRRGSESGVAPVVPRGSASSGVGTQGTLVGGRLGGVEEGEVEGESENEKVDHGTESERSGSRGGEAEGRRSG
jgi:Amt family ammonium transporter